METKTTVLDNVVDSLHAETKDVICEANDALVVQQNEKKNVKNDILNILMNVSKCVGFENYEKLLEAEEKIHFSKMKKLLDCAQVADYTDAEARNKFED